MGGLSTLGRSTLGGSIRNLADNQRAIRAGKKQEAIRQDALIRVKETERLHNEQTQQQIDLNNLKLTQAQELHTKRQRPQHIKDSFSSMYQNPVIRNERMGEFKRFLGDEKATVAKTFMFEEFMKGKIGTKEQIAAEKYTKQNAWGKTEDDMTWLKMNFKQSGDDANGKRAQELKETYEITKPEEVDAWRQRSVEMQTMLGVKESETDKRARIEKEDAKKREIAKEAASDKAAKTEIRLLPETEQGGAWAKYLQDKKDFGYSVAEIKVRTLKKEDKVTGTLTESTVLREFDNFALDEGEPKLKAIMYRKYLTLRREGYSRENAFNQVISEFAQTGGKVVSTHQDSTIPEFLWKGGSQ